MNELADAPPLTSGCKILRELWEKAAWSNAGDVAAEDHSPNSRLLRWRLHGMLADLTGDLISRFESYAAMPDLAVSQFTLRPLALADAQRADEAMPCLRSAFEQNRLDRDSVRAYFDVLGRLGLVGAQHELVRERQRMSQELPQRIPIEPWFAAQGRHPRRGWPRRDHTGLSGKVPSKRNIRSHSSIVKSAPGLSSAAMK